ncbi:MAG: IPT/TIG domain-containing protein, partial [Legionella sp.]
NATPDNSIISLQLNLLPQSNKLYQPLATGINVLSTTQATLIVPAIVDNGSEQRVDVSIQGPDGQRITLSDGYTYTNAQNQPVVSSINPVQGSTAGNTLVTITGQNLGTTTAVISYCSQCSYYIDC